MNNDPEQKPPPKLIHQQHLNYHQMVFANSDPNRRQNQQRQQQQARQRQRQKTLGGKDLIIRMLAEVFQVGQTEDGQTRWQQISTSLVPVSLYSRTTSRWLNYLLAASSAAASSQASVMSPDSRDFLLLLQQFHRSQPRAAAFGGSPLGANTNNNNIGAAISEQQQQTMPDELIVFQVVAHDFIEGMCKKIVSIRLGQPGTRLGQASDFFVYWKEQTRPTNCCPLNRFTSADISAGPTWGLNFASVNDAKLFYDICSLNLVDLDFNSDYLKLLAINGRRLQQIAPMMSSFAPLQQQQQQANRGKIATRDSNQLKTMKSPKQLVNPNHSQDYEERALDRDFRKQQQQQQQHLCQMTTESSIKRKPPFHTNLIITPNKCPTCKHAIRGQQQTIFKRLNDEEEEGGGGGEVEENVCPVHYVPIKCSRQDSGSMRIRARSRSASRQQNGASCQYKFGCTTNLHCKDLWPNSSNCFQRSRSFSTPNSPEKSRIVDEQQNCPVHFRPTSRASGSSFIEHHPNCSTQMEHFSARARQQYLSAGNNADFAEFNQPTARPEKPARGVLRDCSGEQTGTLISDQSLRQSSLASSSQQLHSKRTPKARYLGHLQTTPKQSFESRAGSGGSFGAQAGSQFAAAADQVPGQESRGEASKRPVELRSFRGNSIVDREAAREFVGSRAAQRRSTNVDLPTGSASNYHDLELSGRNARLARAQYANSKKMKEFLSLDAGGVQSTPTQLASLNQRFQQQIKLANESQSQNQNELEGNRSKQLEASESGGPNSMALDGSMRNVSTTTADLPLDAQTRKRMFKLSSEEVISERTEPSTTVHSQLGHPKQPQVRAVSLGPAKVEVCDLRDWNARSNVGRRRSLERTMCVDLDPAPPSAAFRQRLSPLAQSSASPKSSGSNGGVNFVPTSGSSRGNKLRASAGKRARTRSSGEENNNNNNQSVASSRTAMQSHSSRCPDLMSFKSAPNVNELCGRVRQLEEAEEHCQVPFNLATCTRTNFNLAPANCHQIGPLAAPPAGGAKLRRTGLSSYAIPLCSGDQQIRSSAPSEAHSFGRQSHSCPNSLRRKRIEQSARHCQLCSTANSEQNLEKFASEISPPQAQTTNHDLQFLADHRNCIGVCNLNQQLSAPLRCWPIAARGIKSTNQRPQARPANQLCQQHTRGCNHCLGMQQQQRPWSSLSSRSPLHYGLYESDDDDDQDDIEQDLGCHFADTQAEFEHNDSCCPMLYDDRPTSAVWPPVESGSSFKPFQGYDQTLARAALRSRRRAKSQPPPAMEPTDQIDSETRTGTGTSHLNKSMENVQKLIREVQHELDLLKRQSPLNPTIQCFRSAPKVGAECLTAHKAIGGQVEAQLADARRAAQQSVSRPHFKPQSGLEAYVEFDWHFIAERGLRCYGHFHRFQREFKSVAQCERNFLIKMLKEERQQEGKRLLIDNAPKLTSGSATKRAGQFKCVGAIRKAGFLSVKKWILKRRQSVELARKQGWKRYWVCLRGTSLLFHSIIERQTKAGQIGAEETTSDSINLLSWLEENCGSQLVMASRLINGQTGGQQVEGEFYGCNLSQCFIEREPRHLIIIEGAIAQPIPEHPKRDFVFCLSTTFGDAYLFQASCQLEADNWIGAMHNACAASVARDLGRQEAIKLFETKIRHLELEAEKKLFLRQRLESRLTSMASMGPIGEQAPTSEAVHSSCSTSSTTLLAPDKDTDCEQVRAQKVTMRQLLSKLNRQLHALDTYIEQVRCEIYQLRCYLSSCNSQQLFYQRQRQLDNSSTTSLIGIELPHPRSLLAHVGKPTKLLLIKMGVFTVSSFHAYIHARLGSAESILERIQLSSAQQQLAADPECPLELRVRSQSISESLLLARKNQHIESELQTNAEQLIHLSNLRSIQVRLTRKLAAQIGHLELESLETSDLFAPHSDDRYSIETQHLDYLAINLKLHSDSGSMSIIKQVLDIVNPDGGQSSAELDFLNYYLSLAMLSNAHREQEQEIYVAKRRETLDEMPKFDYLELLEKIVFQVELSRQQIDEEASVPFGISIGAQLFVGKLQNLLNVYCSYIEWSSVADKAGLRDDDELLSINGIAVMDLDMMFVECLVQEENKLALIVRSSRCEAPRNSIQLHGSRWRSGENRKDRDDGDGIADRSSGGRDPNLHRLASSGSQIISDEYISTLVCPPPPTKSNAVRLFANPNNPLLQQQERFSRPDEPIIKKSSLLLPATEIGPAAGVESSSTISEPLINATCQRERSEFFHRPQVEQSEGKTEQLKQDESAKNGPIDGNDAQISPFAALEREATKTVSKQHSKTANCQTVDSNSIERLRKSIHELLETEYVYIKHLETISEHYMSPLEAMNYLNIDDLRRLSQTISDLIQFQRNFFDKLTGAISSKLCSDDETFCLDEYDELNGIVHQLSTFNEIGQFESLLFALGGTFSDESEKFKIYAAYCAAYSRLQRLLHSKRISSNISFCSLSFASPLPSALDTFIAPTTGVLNLHAGSPQQQVANKQDSAPSRPQANSSHQLKQLSEFLANLDSSSSSVSLSLPKSSSLSSSTVSLEKAANASELNKPQRNGTTNKSQQSAASANATNTISASSSSSFSSKSAHQQNFESYLIKPIQRIVKYPMLLSSISLAAQQCATKNYHLNNCPDANEVEPPLKAAVRQMESVVGHVNDVQRVYDEFESVLANIERRFLDQQHRSMHNQCNTDSTLPRTGLHSSCSSTSISRIAPISLGIDQLLHFGPVDWLNVHEFAPKLKKSMALKQMLFVYSSCVVFVCTEQLQQRGNTTKRKVTVSPNQPITATTNSSSGLSQLKNFHVNRQSYQTTNEVIRYQSLIPANEVQVRSVAASSLSLSQSSSSASATSNKSGDSFYWELFRCSSVNSNSSLLCKTASNNNNNSSSSSIISKRNNIGRIYLLASPTNEIRSAFMRKIRLIIRESVRNLSLPLARSPSSKSLTPKKLSSPSSGTNTNSSCSASLSPGRELKEVNDDASGVNCKFNSQVDSFPAAKSIQVNN